MKKIFYLLLFAALPSVVAAQVEKSVEVTKDYVPSVVGAAKLAMAPTMIDTAVLRPDIDYSITPLAMSTTFTTKPIRPATVTYWEFNRPRPFYLKLGAGAPLRSVGDFYATTQNPSTGYLMGYLNHDGRYADIRNDFGVKADALRLNNRAGVAAGKYMGNHLLEGEFSYDNRLMRRYGGVVMEEASNSKINYGEFGVMVRLGDDFTDLSRVNFNVALRGTLFNDASEWGEKSAKARQTQLGVDLALARKFGHHTLRLQGMYEHRSGTRAITDYWSDLLSAGARYGYSGEVVDFALGADYYYDKIVGVTERHYVLPALSVRFNFGARGFLPYIEVDGKLRDNSFAALTRQNPYTTRKWLDKSTIHYNLRIGADGAFARGKLAYRIFVETSIRENQLFWTSTDLFARDAMATFTPVQAHQTVLSFHGELEYKPANRFHLLIGLHGYTYDDNTALQSGSPIFEGRVEARYYAKKVSFGVQASMLGERKWSIVDGVVPIDTYRVPFTLDLSADVDWRLSSGFSLFAELNNLADMKLYEVPYYRDYGIGFMVGVKFAF